MAMPKGRILDKYEPHSLSDCLDIPYKAIQNVAEKFMTGAEYTVSGLAAELGMSLTNTREQIYYLQKHKLIYIAKWGKTLSNNWTAMYKAGNDANVPAPGGISTLVVKTPEPPPPKKPVEPTPLSYLNELAKALIPTRTEQEQYEVNWAYWNHLARRAA